MLTPTVATRFSWLYACSNVPATSLTRSVPHGQDASVLSLGCGSLTNVLYTAYLEKGLPSRKIDITCCDTEEKVIARNIVLLSFILDGNQKLSDESLWDSYYHLFIDGKTADALLEQTTKLLSISASVSDWNKSKYSSAIKFCDADTLSDVRRVWERIRNAAEKCQQEDALEDFRKNFQASKDVHDKSDFSIIGGSGIRATAPLSFHSIDNLRQAWTQYWKDGTVTPKPATVKYPNPLLAGIISESEILHYSSDPVQGFHLATAFAPLAHSSPLKPAVVKENFEAAAAAKTQFAEWISALKPLLGKKLIIRYTTADALVFCHSLQCAAEGKPSANLYRRPGDTRSLELDQSAYGITGKCPAEFDLIETSNFCYHLGALNVLVAAGPLLKEQPWATLFTDILIQRSGSEVSSLVSVLCGDIPTVLFLLGFSPVEYWTGTKFESHISELFKGYSQLSSRVAWKPNHQLSGFPGASSKIHIDSSKLVRFLIPITRHMFGSGDPTVSGSFSDQDSMYPYHHHGSFTALLKLIKKRVKTDWTSVHINLLNITAQDPALLLASNFTQDFGSQLHLLGVGTQPWIDTEVKHSPSAGAFNAWNSIPAVVSVTLVVPREVISRMNKDWSQETLVSPPLVGSLKNAPGSSSQWHNMFGDVHFAFGNIRTTGTRDKDGFEVSIDRDDKGWAGDAPLVASFYVPTAALQVEPKHTLVGLMVQLNKLSSQIWIPIIGEDSCIFQTNLNEEANVFVTKHLPGQKGYPILCAHVKEPADESEDSTNGYNTKIMVEGPTQDKILKTVKGRLDFTSHKAKKLLKDKVPIELRQDNPFIIDVVFGDNELVCPLRFPLPVTKEEAKSRVARTSAYIEVIAPVAQPGSSKELSDFVSPSVLSTKGLPSATNAPHINLDALPIVDLESEQEKLRWLTTLTSLQFSDREKRLREATSEGSGISSDPRVNFKESLFSMFMLSSGLQGGQTGLFAINHPGQGGIHMLIFVSALRLDGHNGSVILDAAVIPFTSKLIESGEMETFLLILRTLECCTLEVNDEELLLWKKTLPSMVERCRTWSHGLHCEYKKKNATVPLGLKLGQPVLCSCSKGRVPRGFMSLPEWDTAAAHASRVAISPVYAVPFVEQVVDQQLLDQFNGLDLSAERCRHCGKEEGKDGVSLKKCLRCMKAKYCSGECQKKDWKKHRMECEEA